MVGQKSALSSLLGFCGKAKVWVVPDWDPNRAMESVRRSLGVAFSRHVS